MIDLEKLIGVPLPDGPVVLPPVLKDKQDDLAKKLRGAAWFLELMADHVERAPFADGCFDQANAWAGKLLGEAGDALTVFRETRGCEGRS